MSTVKRLPLVKNPYLLDMKGDNLFHLAIRIPDFRNLDIIENQFGDVKFVIMGGTAHRMHGMAMYLRSMIQPEIDPNEGLINISAPGRRFSMFKVGPVLVVSHGMGMPSMSIVLNELIKLVRYAQCNNPIFIRVGTSGGLGVEPGTVIVTQNCFNGLLKNEYEMAILGQRKALPASFDTNLVNDLLKCSYNIDAFHVIRADTLSVDCFYEGQARMDGAFCSFTQGERNKFLETCYEKGIRNIEMETLVMAALTKEAGIKAAAICVTLVDRSVDDQILIGIPSVQDFEARPILIVGRYLKKALASM